MIIRFQQGGINLTVSDPRSAYNWLTLQSCGLDCLYIWSLSCHIEIQSSEAWQKNTKRQCFIFWGLREEEIEAIK